MTADLCHEALFYDSDAAFADALVPFLRDGLTAGDALVVAVREHHIALLRDALGDDAGRVAFIDRDEWYRRPAITIAGWQSRLARSRAGGHGRARFVGEVAFGGVEQHRAWTRYESVLNALFADAPTWIVCPYDSRILPAEVLADAHRTHPVVRDPGRRNSLGYRHPGTLLRELPEPLPPATGTPLADLVLHDAADLGAVRRAVRAIVSGWPDEPADDLLLVVTELAVNALRYGRGERRLRVWRRDATVVCEVADQGPGPSDPLAGYAAPSTGGPGGRGLWLVRRLCDAVAIECAPTRTRVRAAITAR